ncbi:MAG: hypothetical protein Q9225_005957 [Loekoesia sp. 1 TL-2023]
MGGAGKKRAKAERQANQRSRNNGGSENGNKAGYDGPSERPGSSAGPGQQSSSRGRPPSNAPVQTAPPAAPASTRTSSRPPTAGGSPQTTRSSSRPPTTAGPPMRDPALDPSRPQAPVLNPRIEWGGNAFNYYSGDAVREFRGK